MFFPIILLICLSGCCNENSAKKDFPAKSNLVDIVNPLVGTDSNFELSNGNTYPAIAVPWGMNFWTPQTNEMGDGWGYQYEAYKIQSFKQTHQPSPWINDYAAFALFPETGDIKLKGSERASWYSHKAEVAKPYYYSVYLADYDVTTEITPTCRAAQFCFTFPENEKSHILIDAFNKGSMVKIIPEERKVIGYCRNNNGGVPDNFLNYFVIIFDKDFEQISTWDNFKLKPGSKEAEANHVGAVLSFKTRHGEKITAKVASSFISQEQALRNLNTEIGNDDFAATKGKAQAEWNKELSRIVIEGGNDDQRSTFYTALYRTMLFPRKFYEIDANNKVVHYSPYNGQVLPGYMFTDNGFWDTFRAVFPYFTLMHPELESHIMEGLVNTYKESGWLPEWASPGHRDCMIGSNSAVIIAQAYLNGVKNFDINTLYEAMLKNSENEGPMMSMGRFGADYYNKLGYVPYDVNKKENVARTLEYAYADWCIAQVARKLKRPQKEIDRFEKRAMNYKNVFDKSTNLMRGKNENGEFQTPFRPLKWGDAFTEGNSLHYTWSVFQDVQGLIDLMGSNDKFISMLDSVFTMPPLFDNSYYGITIHEIREMQIANMGNYAHGNQPIQHMIYLYNYAGAPWKAQKHLRDVMTKLYTSAPDGLCGDEDNGQTSAWYVFSSLGFYPVTPGTGEYVIGSPLFEKATIKLPNGKAIVINSKNNTGSSVYVDGITFHGKAYEKNYFNHQDLLQGGIIDFKMSDKPNKTRGIDKYSKPYSFSKQFKQ
jgi:predicted alpha-1,2-mannosidase